MRLPCLDRNRESAGNDGPGAAIGFANAVRLYWSLIVAACAISGLLLSVGELAPSPWLLLPLPLPSLAARHLDADRRRLLTPWTGRFLLLFGAGYGFRRASRNRRLSR